MDVDIYKGSELESSIQVFILSFNRAEFLQNCIESIEKHWPQVKINVVDDHSDDADTQSYLQSLSDIRVLTRAEKLQGRHGGLYKNMQLALDLAEEEGTELVLFLQDDMQLVRDIAHEEVEYFRSFFAHYGKAGFLQPLFLKGARRKRDEAITQLAKDFPVYFRNYPENGKPRGISYSDCVIAHVPRLQNANWTFKNSEMSNAYQADKLFGKMGFMLHPFAMYLPEVPVYRGKVKTRGVQLAENRGGATPNAYLSMADDDVQRLKQRNPSTELPVAETYLQTERAAKKPFRYSQINAYPMLRVLHKIEQILHTR